MKREAVLKIHKWSALVTGIALAIVGLTGAVMAFDDEIGRALYRGIMEIAPSPVNVTLDDQLASVRRTLPAQQVFGLRLGAPDRATTFFTGSQQVMVNGHTGEVTGSRLPGDVLRVLRKMHEGLMLGPPGKILVVASAFTLLFLSGTGIVLWWREKRLRIRGRFAARDSHHSVGIVSDAYLFVLAVTALFMALPLAPLVFKAMGSKPPDRPTLSSTIARDAAPLSLDRIVGIARVALPGLTPEVVLFPRGEKGIYRVGMREGEVASLAGDIQIDRYSGRVLAADRVNNADPAMRLILGMRAFHTGRLFGIPSQIAASLAGLVLAAQGFTGFLMWRRTRDTRTRIVYREEPAAAPSWR